MEQICNIDLIDHNHPEVKFLTLLDGEEFIKANYSEVRTEISYILGLNGFQTCI